MFSTDSAEVVPEVDRHSRATSGTSQPESVGGMTWQPVTYDPELDGQQYVVAATGSSIAALGIKN